MDTKVVQLKKKKKNYTPNYLWDRLIKMLVKFQMWKNAFILWNNAHIFVLFDLKNTYDTLTRGLGA